MKYSKPIALLKLSEKLSVIEKKCFNLMLCELSEKFIKTKFKASNEFETFYLTDHLSHILRERCNDLRIKSSTYAERIFKKDLHIVDGSKHIQVFKSFDISKDEIAFVINHEVYKYFKKNKRFNIDVDDHNQIKKKNALTLFEICMSQLHEEEKQDGDTSFKNNVMYIKQYSLKEIYQLYGESLENLDEKAQFKRSKLLPSIAYLNGLKMGISIQIKNEYSEKFIVGYFLEIIIQDAEKYNALFSLN